MQTATENELGHFPLVRKVPIEL